MIYVARFPEWACFSKGCGLQRDRLQLHSNRESQKGGYLRDDTPSRCEEYSIRAVRSGFGRNGHWSWKLPLPLLIASNEKPTPRLQAGPIFHPWKRRLRLLN